MEILTSYLLYTIASLLFSIFILLTQCAASTDNKDAKEKYSKDTKARISETYKNTSTTPPHTQSTPQSSTNNEQYTSNSPVPKPNKQSKTDIKNRPKATAQPVAKYSFVAGKLLTAVQNMSGIPSAGSLLTKTDRTQTQSDTTMSSPRGSGSAPHVTMKEYTEELIEASQPSVKGPEYEEMTYIKGPFSIYTKFKMRQQRKNDERTKKSSDYWKDNEIKRGRRGSTINTTRVTFEVKAKGKGIPRDQLRPHKLRKDRQIKNPYRRIYVHNKLKLIGGEILDLTTGKYVHVGPSR